MNKKVIGLFLKYDDGSETNINELPKEQYELLLEQMHKLRLAYFAIMSGNRNE